MPTPLLTAQNSEGHVHLIIGSNPLASARCARSIEVGAKPKCITPENAQIHYVLLRRIEEGEVEWHKKEFEDNDLMTLGREEINYFVDAVFVTVGRNHALSV